MSSLAWIGPYPTLLRLSVYHNDDFSLVNFSRQILSRNRKSEALAADRKLAPSVCRLKRSFDVMNGSLLDDPSSDSKARFTAFVHRYICLCLSPSACVCLHLSMSVSVCLPLLLFFPNIRPTALKIFPIVFNSLCFFGRCLDKRRGRLHPLLNSLYETLCKPLLVGLNHRCKKR